MDYKPRYSEPNRTNRNFIHVSRGGKNSCILIKGNSVLPNCVGYAWGRFMEITGKTPKLSRRDAKDWYGYKEDGYKRGKVPKLGAVICWGPVPGSKRRGHVAIVEDIKTDGTIIISQSGYNSSRFWVSRLRPPYKMVGYDLQGFIYPPITQTKKKGKEAIAVTITLNQLSIGDKGKEVKTLQRILYCYFNCPSDLSIDGEFGKITKAYVLKIQKILKLEADGIVGKNTWGGLLKLL